MQAKILHRTIKVKVIPSCKPGEEENYVYGETIADKDGISVMIADDIQTDEDFVETILHEILHAAEHATGRHLKHSAIHALAAAQTQALISMGLIDPAQWRAYMRANALHDSSVRPDSKP